MFEGSAHAPALGVYVEHIVAVAEAYSDGVAVGLYG